MACSLDRRCDDSALVRLVRLSSQWWHSNALGAAAACVNFKPACRDLCQVDKISYGFLHLQGQAEAAFGACRIVFGTKTFAHFLQYKHILGRRLGDISFCFIILLLHFYIIGGNFSAILGTTYGAKSELDGSVELLVPTSYYEGSRRPCEKFIFLFLSFRCCCTERGTAHYSNFLSHKICLIKIFVKISKLFCCVGSLRWQCPPTLTPTSTPTANCKLHFRLMLVLK